jgi:hypothetical protein
MINYTACRGEFESNTKIVTFGNSNKLEVKNSTKEREDPDEKSRQRMAYDRPLVGKMIDEEYE